MSNISIAIERFVIQAGPLSDPQRGRRLIDEALAILAEKLQESPFERWRSGGALEIATITLGDLPADALFGPRGAERLADALYQELTRRLS